MQAKTQYSTSSAELFNRIYASHGHMLNLTKPYIAVYRLVRE